jgi:hypothetical protein
MINNFRLSSKAKDLTAEIGKMAPLVILDVDLINRTRAARIKEDGSSLCLIALSGDCAKGGMGDANAVLPIQQKHFGLVKDYLEAELAFDMHCAFMSHSSGLNYGSPETQAAFQKKNDAGMALRDAGVFHHKYHQRTTWELAYMDELDDIERYKPFVVMYPKPQTEKRGA